MAQHSDHVTGLGSAAAIVGAALATLALAACTTAPDSPSASVASSSATATDAASQSTSPTPTPPGTEPTRAERSNYPIEVKETVPLDEVGDFGDGIKVGVARVRAVEADGGGGIGDLAGPAIAVTIELTNGGATPISLDQVVVTATYGRDDIPAPGVFNDTRADYFAGSLGVGDATEGTYVFSLPKDQRNRVTILVSYAGGAPNVAFKGSLR